MIRALKVIYVAGATATAAAVAGSPKPPDVSVAEHYAIMVATALAWPLVLAFVAADIADDARRGAI